MRAMAELWHLKCQLVTMEGQVQPIAVYVGFVIGRLAVERTFLQVFQFSIVIHHFTSVVHSSITIPEACDGSD
jgi:hypothetical protein